MAECLPWVQQGDLFEELPIFRPSVVAGQLVMPQRSGAAVLVTENCQLDKCTNSGQPRKTMVLQFLPLVDVGSLNADAWRRLQAMEDSPPEAIYVGEFEGTHLFGRLGEAFSIPGAYFRGAAWLDYSHHLAADADDPRHLTLPDDAFPRLMTMDASLVTLMHRKMWLYWTHLAPAQGQLSV